MNTPGPPAARFQFYGGFATGVGCMAAGLGLRASGYLVGCRVLLAAASTAMLFAGASGWRGRVELGGNDAQTLREGCRKTPEHHRGEVAVWSVEMMLVGVGLFLMACLIGPAQGR